MPYFNTSNLTNATDYTDLIQYVDANTGYMLGPLLVMAVWFISFMALGQYAKEEGFAAASLLAMITGVIVWAMTGSWFGVAIALAATIASALMLFLRR